MNKIRQTIKSLCLTVAALVAGVCHGATWYVAPDGNDTNDGTQENPLFSLRTAIETKAKSGDTILLAPGIHQYNTEKEYDYWTDKSLTIKCTSECEYAVIDGKNFPVKFVPASGSVVSGIIFQNAKPTTNPGGGIQPYVVRVKADVTVTNCGIRNCSIGDSGCAVYVEGGEMLNCFVTNNVSTVATCWSAGLYIKGGRVADCDFSYNRGPAKGGVNSSSSGIAGAQFGGLVERCTILHNENTLEENNGTIWNLIRAAVSPDSDIINRNCLFAYNVSSSQENGGGAIKMWSDPKAAYNLSLENATICFNTNRSNNKDGIYASGKCTIMNCIVYDNGDSDDKTSISVPSSASVTISNSCFPECDKAAFGSGTTVKACVYTAPCFVNAAAGDFHLAAGFAGIDAGLEIDGVRVDLDGKVRPVDSYNVAEAFFDMGCYEYQEHIDTASALVWVSQTGTPQAPYDTPEKGVSDINTAIGIINDSYSGIGTIRVAGGTYAHTGVIEVKGRIAIVGEAGNDVVLDAKTTDGGKGATAFFKLQHTGASVSGLILQNAKPSAGSESDSLVYVAAGKVKDCVVRNCSTDMEYASIVFVDGGSLVGCVMSNHVINARFASMLRVKSGFVGDSVVSRNESKLKESFSGGVWQQGGHVADTVISGNYGPVFGVNTIAANGIAAGGYQSGGLMERCIISGNTNTLETNYQPGGWFLVGPATNRNCLIVNNKTHSSGGVGGIKVDQENAVLENATVCFNETVGTSADGLLISNGGAAQNCIIYYNGARTSDGKYDDFKIVLGGTIRNSCYSQLMSGSNGEAIGCINKDPLFRNVDAGNFRLKNASPCINAGINAFYGSDDKDLAGRRRIVGGTVDMGCYEYASGFFIMVR